ncbi:hypothetical protein H072_8458 [Dactylellina haptotyla CBS 200.50]|uniref:NAD(P)H-hydrate epimerase n=1 Tax=Dactylellina haptotyla (strain CBS 200.50) TaxID=1284197 RepID=S8A9Y1_DACHA|nr:hypothetical protein H072_8458 [Dactylellina haptotyla CBS 200.50]
MRQAAATLSRLTGILNNFQKRPFHSNSPAGSPAVVKMSFNTLGAKEALELDKDIMSSGGFTLDQLMELAGLSVSQAVYKVHPPSKGDRILVFCGPGNNGGDGLVAARHLWYYGYKPTVYYPKKGKNEFYDRLSIQLQNLNIPFTTDYITALTQTDHILDAIFGFSFSGAVRAPFDEVIDAITSSSLPVTSVDVPSSWDIATGPPLDGPGKNFMPETLVSLTAPKPLVKYFKGRHFLGGRFIPPNLEEKYGLKLKDVYEGIDQVTELPN